MTHGKFYKIGRTTQKLKRFFCIDAVVLVPCITLQSSETG